MTSMLNHSTCVWFWRGRPNPKRHLWDWAQNPNLIRIRLSLICSKNMVHELFLDPFCRLLRFDSTWWQEGETIRHSYQPMTGGWWIWWNIFTFSRFGIISSPSFGWIRNRWLVDMIRVWTEPRSPEDITVLLAWIGTELIRLSVTTKATGVRVVAFEFNADMSFALAFIPKSDEP